MSLRITPSNAKLGIGASRKNPSYNLDVEGTAGFSSDVTIGGDASITGSLSVAGLFQSTNDITVVNTGGDFGNDFIIDDSTNPTDAKSHGLHIAQTSGAAVNRIGVVKLKAISASTKPELHVGFQSQLDANIKLTSTAAVTLPKGTTNEAPGTATGVSAEVGQIRYNTTQKCLEVYDEDGNGTTKWMRASTPPVGATYIQWYQADDPNTLYYNTT